jgi:flagellar export protein FliJ
MKRFVFRLQAVMRLREQESERAREALLRCGEICRTLEGELLGVSEESRILHDTLVESRNQPGWIARQPSFQAAYQDSLERIRAATDRLVDARQKQEEARTAYAEARQQVQVVERLEEKERAKHLQESRRQEERELEDIYLGGRSLASVP